MAKKTTTPARLEYSNPYMRISHTRATFATHAKDYFVLDLGPRAGLVAVRDGSVLLARQYRFLIDGFSWEIPGGRVDEGETPEQSAIRECIEETGVSCADLRPLAVYYPGLDNFNNRTSLFCSEKVAEAGRFAPDDTEVVEIRWTPLEDCLAMVFRGEIMDALTVVGLLAYRTLQQSAIR